MNFLMDAWSYFATNILQQPAWMIGLIVLIGYILLKKPWYDVLGGTLKAVIGYMILAVGSSGLVNNFRPVLVGLGERFNLDAMVIDPYFGQNAVTAGVEETFGKPFSQVMILLLLAFIINIVLVRFRKLTKLRSLFTHGSCTGTAGVYRLLADSVRAAGTSDKQHCPASGYGCRAWSVLGGRL